MSDSKTSDDPDPVLYNCRKCRATVTKEEMESHRELHTEKRKLPQRECHRELPTRNRTAPQKRYAIHKKRYDDWMWPENPKFTTPSTNTNELKSTIRRLKKENGEQKQRISEFTKVQETQRSEINALQRKERHNLRQIGELTKEVARLKMQLDNSPQQRESTPRILELSRPPAKKLRKAVSECVSTT